MNHDIGKTDSLHILVVDDILANLKLLTNILSNHGYQVRPASSGKLALRSVAVELPDLILLDIKMPDMNGYEVCQHLKADERSRSIPVIFISALDDVTDKVQGLNVGGVDYITKPFQPEEVLARVETHLSLRHLQRQLEAQNTQLQQEITERKQMEKEIARLDRLNLVGEMAAGIGHELRNPMTTVRGFLQIFKSKKEFEQYREYIDLMIEELDRANSIITEYLSMAKNKAVDLKAQNLNIIVEALFPLIQADAMNSDKYVQVELEEIPDLLLDEKEIRQLILNLVRNGLEAMLPRGNLTIKTFTDGDGVVLSMQDQGRGISADILEKIGMPFFTTKDNGTGLGLAVCYSIAARHNATINIQTGPNGTTLLVRFKVNR